MPGRSMCSTNILTTSGQYSHFILPDNTKKLKDSCFFFQGVLDENIVQKWINDRALHIKIALKKKTRHFLQR